MPVQDDQPEIINLPDNASMHDSGSSFKDAGLVRDRLSESAQADKKKGQQASATTAEE